MNRTLNPWFAIAVLGFIAHAILRSAGADLPWLLGFLVLCWGFAGLHIINEWERRPVLRLGRYVRTAGPGPVWIEPLVHAVLPAISIQDVSRSVTVENVQTHDNVRVTIIAVLTTRIASANVRQAVLAVKGVADATLQRAQATLVEVGAASVLDDLLARRDAITSKVKTALEAKVSPWGVDVVAVEIKDFKIADPDVERAIALKARAEKEAQAELKRAELQGEIVARLNEAATHLTVDGWRLKAFETLTELTRSAQNNTVLIPTHVLDMLGAALPGGTGPGTARA
ncbi:MAG TPA: SPFH domain-containing protein [Gemmatimonadales bacterium]|jgi:regulator of protease activity HflC (stomatin/prohibitin superfamily)|nr:SPFH domain-containing protein [Gemmatimonadales bacterium]